MVSGSATLDNFLHELNSKQSVMNGWGAALNLTESAVTEVAQSQWAPLASKPIKTAWRNSSKQPLKLTFQLGDPDVRLQPGHPVAMVRHRILNPTIHNSLGQKQHLKAAKPYLESTVPLTIITRGDEKSVVLNFAAGSCATYGLDAKDVNATEVADQVQEWFSEHHIVLPVTTVNFRKHSGVASLQPTGVKLATIKTRDGNRILQVLITTHGSAPKDSHLDLDEPVPTANGASFSVVINSKAVIEDVIVDGFNKGTGQVKLVAAAPDSHSAAWHAQTRNPMEHKGGISCDACDMDMSCDCDCGMKFLGTANAGLKLTTFDYPGNMISFDLTLAASYPIKVSGSGSNQKIHMTANPASVTAVGGIENVIKPQLEEFLNTDIKNDMSAISMEPISSFVLKTLSCPGHRPTIQTAQLPGDFVIVGTLERI